MRQNLTLVVYNRTVRQAAEGSRTSFTVGSLMNTSSTPISVSPTTDLVGRTRCSLIGSLSLNMQILVDDPVAYSEVEIYVLASYYGNMRLILMRVDSLCLSRFSNVPGHMNTCLIN